MKFFCAILILFAAMAAGLYVAYVKAFPEATLRYRFTLHAVVDGAPVEGSGVIELWRQDATLLGPIGGLPGGLIGEAVVLDLPGYKKVFATFHGSRKCIREDRTYPVYSIVHIFSDYFDIRLNPVEQLSILKSLKPKRNVAFDLLPMLIYFDDVNDSKSVRQVLPDAFPETFGQNVRLVRATMAITDDPVTTGILKLLPWLKSVGLLSNTRYKDTNDLADDLTRYDIWSPER